VLVIEDMMKKWIFGIFILSLILSNFNLVFAQTEKIEINFFYNKICPYCREAEKFLNVLEKKYPEVKINRYLVTEPDNREILEELARKTGAEEYIGLVPMIFIGEDFFLGFDSPQGIGREIENYLQEQLGIKEPREQEVFEDRKIILPLLGEVDLKVFPLPILAVALGFFDGFNVCSLGALILILSLAIGLRSRQKILLFGGLFILTTTVVYGVLMVMWFYFFALLGEYLRNFQILIGAMAILGGIYFFRQYLKFRQRAPVCEIGAGEKITSGFFKNIQESFRKPKNILLTIGSIITFAFLVTVIEFPCSAAVPVIFTGILAQAQLPGFLHFLYIVLFLIFYMLDEIFVFLIAVLTTRLWLASGKFVTLATLAQAIILGLLGSYYLFGI
jgi:glutaredoxin